MSLIDFFKKKGASHNRSYDAAAEFFVTPELIIQESKQHNGYSLAIDTGYEDLTRTVKRVALDGDEISIKTETSYVDFQELFAAMGINETPKTVSVNASLEQSTAKDVLEKRIKSNAKAKVKAKVKAKGSPSNSSLVPGSMLSSDLPEKIALKQSEIVEDGVYYKPIKVVSTLEVQGDGLQKDTDIATSYYLAPISCIDGVYKELSAVQCAHIVETSWSDAYIEAMNGDTSEDHSSTATSPVSRKSGKASVLKNTLKAPAIVALSLATAFASLYGYNQYQQNNNPLSIAASNGNVNTYMSAKGANADEYTQRQLEATKAALGSMGIDVSADADIGCLIE